MSTHVYNIHDDFTFQTVDLPVFQTELTNSSLGSEHTLTATSDGTDVTVTATPDLAAGEIPSLDGLVANHRGTPSNHVYNIATDFPNGNVNLSNLRTEITTAMSREHIFDVTSDGTDVTVVSTPSLRDTEVPTLDGVIAAHQGFGVVYTYNIANDFPNQAVATEVLLAEIDDSSLGSGHNFAVSSDGTNVTITSDPLLDAGEITTLDGIIAAHQGVPFVTGTQRATANPEATNTTNSWQSVLTLSSGPLMEGSYMLNTSLELKVASTDLTSGAQARILYNGNEVVAAAGNLAVFDIKSASSPINVSNSATPTLEVQFRRVGTANTASIRRVRLSIARFAGSVSES